MSPLKPFFPHWSLFMHLVLVIQIWFTHAFRSFDFPTVNPQDDWWLNVWTTSLEKHCIWDYVRRYEYCICDVRFGVVSCLVRCVCMYNMYIYYSKCTVFKYREMKQSTHVCVNQPPIALMRSWNQRDKLIVTTPVSLLWFQWNLSMTHTPRARVSFVLLNHFLLVSWTACLADNDCCLFELWLLKSKVINFVGWYDSCVKRTRRNPLGWSGQNHILSQMGYNFRSWKFPEVKHIT